MRTRIHLRVTRVLRSGLAETTGGDYPAYVPNQSLLGFTGVSADQGVSNRYTWSRKLAF